jgi:hypothetical protein
MLTLAGIVIPFTEMSLNTNKNTLLGNKKKNRKRRQRYTRQGKQRRGSNIIINT